MASRAKPFTVATRVTERERALIRAAAADVGVDCSTFIAGAVLDRARSQLLAAISDEDGSARSQDDDPGS